MGLETGTYINSLNSANPLGTDAKSAGDDHLRLIKSTVKATFPNLTGAVTTTQTELNHVAGVTSAIQTQFSGKQPLHDNLTAEAGLTGAADKLAYYTGVGAKALTSFLAWGRSFLAAADVAAARTVLGLDTVSQAEAEAGTATTERSWTAQRVRQAAVRSFPNKVISYTGAGGVVSEGAALNCTTQMPYSNAPPTDTQGDPILDVTITPSRIGAVIEVECFLCVGNIHPSAGLILVAALFKDSDVNAIASGTTTLTQTWDGNILIHKRITAASVTPITFKVRGGPYLSGGYPMGINHTYNGTYGGTRISYIKAEEVA